MIAGDIYDKAVPSAEAVEVFDHLIAELTEAAPDMTIMIISGNHDSGPRINCFRGVLSRQNVHMIGIPPKTEEEFIEKVILQDAYGNVNFYLLPFVKPSMVKEITGTDENGNNLSYDETIHRLIEREKSIRIREIFWLATSFIFLLEKQRKMWKEWIQRFVRWGILMRFLRIYWENSIMRHWAISINR